MAERIIDDFKHNSNLEAASHSAAFAMALEADAQSIGSTIYSGFNKQLVTEAFMNDVSSDYEPIIGISLGFKDPAAIVYPKKMKSLSDFVVFKK